MKTLGRFRAVRVSRQLGVSYVIPGIVVSLLFGQAAVRVAIEKGPSWRLAFAMALVVFIVVIVAIPTAIVNARI